MRIRQTQCFLPSRKSTAAIVALTATLFATGAWAAPPSPWLFIDAPGGGHSAQAVAINDHNRVVGYYHDAGGFVHGFLRAPDGTVTTIDVPSATNTQPIGIDNRGRIAGYASLPGPIEAGFIRNAAGNNYSTFEVPNADETLVRAMNHAGMVAGDVRLTGQSENTRAFIRDTKGVITTFAPANTFEIQTTGIADDGSVTGLFADTSLNIHGFLRDSHGTLTTFSVPGTYATIPFGINQNGQVAGAYRLTMTDPNTHGFVRQPDGTFATFEISGAGIAPAATIVAESINFSGVIVGCYIDTSSLEHGFVRDQNGNLKQLDAPGATTTCAEGLNTRGKIVGLADSRAFRLNRHGWLTK